MQNSINKEKFLRKYFQENFADSKKCFIFTEYFDILDIQNMQQAKEF